MAMGLIARQLNVGRDSVAAVREVESSLNLKWKD